LVVVALAQAEYVTRFVREHGGEVVRRHGARLHRLVQECVARTAVDHDVGVEQATRIHLVSHYGYGQLRSFVRPVFQQIHAVGRVAVVVPDALGRAWPDAHVRHTRQTSPGIEGHRDRSVCLTGVQETFELGIELQVDVVGRPADALAHFSCVDRVGLG
jgi:hypothetical protein